MRFIFVFIFSLLLTSLLCAQWKQQEFIIGTFWGPRLTGNQDLNNQDQVREDLERYRLIKDAGVDMLLFPYGEDNAAITPVESYNLNIAAKAGLKYIVWDSKISIAGGWDKDQPKNNFKSSKISAALSHYRELGTVYKNSLLGFVIKDEPAPVNINPSHLQQTRESIKLLRQFDRSKLAYINLLPVYFTQLDAVKKAWGKTNDHRAYEAYLDSYLFNPSDPSAEPDVVSFDHYLSISKGVDYFYNLYIVRKKAGNKPMWFYSDVRATRSEFLFSDDAYSRFVVFAPLAYGAKGIIYYTWSSADTRIGPVRQHEPKKTTEKYQLVKDMSRYIARAVGPAIMTSDYLGTYHTGDFVYKEASIENTEVLIPEQKLSSQAPFVQSISADNCMVGVFQNKTTKEIYLLIVNRGYNNRFPTISPQVTLKGNYSGKVSEAPFPGGKYSKKTATYKNNTTQFTISNLRPGEGRLIKLGN